MQQQWSSSGSLTRKLKGDWWKAKLCTACVSPLGRILSRGGHCPQCGLRVCKSCRIYDVSAVSKSNNNDGGSGGGQQQQQPSKHLWICVLCSGSTPNFSSGTMPKSSTIGKSMAKSIRRSWTISNPQRSSGPQTDSPVLKSYVIYNDDTMTATSTTTMNHHSTARQFNSLPRLSYGINVQDENQPIDATERRFSYSTLYTFNKNNKTMSNSSVNFIEEPFWDYYDYNMINSNRSSCERSLGEIEYCSYIIEPDEKNGGGGGGGGGAKKNKPVPPVKPERSGNKRSNSLNSYDGKKLSFSPLRTYVVLRQQQQQQQQPTKKRSSSFNLDYCGGKRNRFFEGEGEEDPQMRSKLVRPFSEHHLNTSNNNNRAPPDYSSLPQRQTTRRNSSEERPRTLIMEEGLHNSRKFFSSQSLPKRKSYSETTAALSHEQDLKTPTDLSPTHKQPKYSSSSEEQHYGRAPKIQKPPRKFIPHSGPHPDDARLWEKATPNENSRPPSSTNKNVTITTNSSSSGYSKRLNKSNSFQEGQVGTTPPRRFLEKSHSFQVQDSSSRPHYNYPPNRPADPLAPSETNFYTVPRNFSSGLRDMDPKLQNLIRKSEKILNPPSLHQSPSSPNNNNNNVSTVQIINSETFPRRKHLTRVPVLHTHSLDRKYPKNIVKIHKSPSPVSSSSEDFAVLEEVYSALDEDSEPDESAEKKNTNTKKRVILPREIHEESEGRMGGVGEVCSIRESGAVTVVGGGWVFNKTPSASSSMPLPSQTTTNTTSDTTTTTTTTTSKHGNSHKRVVQQQQVVASPSSQQHESQPALLLVPLHAPAAAGPLTHREEQQQVCNSEPNSPISRAIGSHNNNNTKKSNVGRLTDLNKSQYVGRRTETTTRELIVGGSGSGQREYPDSPRPSNNNNNNNSGPNNNSNNSRIIRGRSSNEFVTTVQINHDMCHEPIVVNPILRIIHPTSPPPPPPKHNNKKHKQIIGSNLLSTNENNQQQEPSSGVKNNSSIEAALSTPETENNKQLINKDVTNNSKVLGHSGNNKNKSEFSGESELQQKLREFEAKLNNSQETPNKTSTSKVNLKTALAQQQQQIKSRTRGSSSNSESNNSFNQQVLLDHQAQFQDPHNYNEKRNNENRNINNYSENLVRKSNQNYENNLVKKSNENYNENLDKSKQNIENIVLSQELLSNLNKCEVVTPHENKSNIRGKEEDNVLVVPGKCSEENPGDNNSSASTTGNSSDDTVIDLLQVNNRGCYQVVGETYEEKLREIISPVSYYESSIDSSRSDTLVDQEINTAANDLCNLSPADSIHHHQQHQTSSNNNNSDISNISVSCPSEPIQQQEQGSSVRSQSSVADKIKELIFGEGERPIVPVLNNDKIKAESPTVADHSDDGSSSSTVSFESSSPGIHQQNPPSNAPSIISELSDPEENRPGITDEVNPVPHILDLYEKEIFYDNSNPLLGPKTSENLLQFLHHLEKKAEELSSESSSPTNHSPVHMTLLNGSSSSHMMEHHERLTPEGQESFTDESNSSNNSNSTTHKRSSPDGEEIQCTKMNKLEEETFQVTSSDSDNSWIEEVPYEEGPPPLDLTLHTIVEESCEDSESEKSLTFPLTNNGSNNLRNNNKNALENYFNYLDPQNSDLARKAAANEDSEFSDTFSESSFNSEVIQPQEDSIDPVDLASTRLEKYFTNLSAYHQQHPHHHLHHHQHSVVEEDSEDSVGSESENDDQIKDKKKKVLKHKRSANVSDDESIFDQDEGAFDTIKKPPKKKENATAPATAMDTSNNKSEEKTQTLTSDQMMNLGAEPAEGEASSSSTTTPKPTKQVLLDRSNSFQWSSDEEVNLMMSKLRHLIKNLMHKSATTPSETNSQLRYFETELIRLMRAEPELKNIVSEYISSEESDDNEFNQFIKDVVTQQEVEKEQYERITASMGGLAGTGAPRGNYSSHLLGTGAGGVSSSQGSSNNGNNGSPGSSNSPALIAKVMHHIGNRLSVWMKDEDEEGTLKCAPSVSSDLNEDRFSWKGSFESTLAAKRQSVGSTDSISSSDFSSQHQAGSGVDRSILRSSSLHHLANSQPIEEKREEEENISNSLPKLNQVTNMPRAQSLIGIKEKVKSARYRPPGFTQAPSIIKQIDDKMSMSTPVLHQESPVHPDTPMNLRSSVDSISSMYEHGVGRINIRGQIQFGLQYNYKLASLEMRVKQCRDLAAVDTKRNRSDPYVKAYLLPDRTKSGKRKTKTKKNTLNPIFEETLKFPLTLSELQSRTLWLSVWHNDIFGKNEFLGQILLPLKDRVFDDPSPVWWSLEELSEEKEDQPRGDLIIALKWLPRTQNTGNLSVLVKEAKNLLPTKNGCPSTFVKCSPLKEAKSHRTKQKTSIARRTLHPIWNQTLYFEDIPDDGIEISLWNYDLLSNHDLIGSIRLDFDHNLWDSMLNRHSFWVEGGLKLDPPT